MKPVTIGPTWQRAEDGKFVLPPTDRTLAYHQHAWCTQWLRQPDGPKAREPWRFTNEQFRFLAWWYAFDDNLRFVYRRGVYRRMKGAGKNPFASAICAIELIGPCRPTGEVDAKGYALGQEHYSSWVQTAAVSRDQTRNTMTLMSPMLSAEAQAEFQMHLGKEIIYAYHGRCRMEAVTSAPRSLEGGRATAIIMDETHHWLKSNDGHAMADVIARNAAKSRDGASRRLAITNAHAVGEDSVAERDYEMWRKASDLAEPSDVLYDSLEAPLDVDYDDDEAVKDAVSMARGDSEWLDTQRILAEIRDAGTTESEGRRFYLNQIWATDDKPFDADKFAALSVKYTVPPGALITLGFDGSRRRDHTALIGTEVTTGHQWVVGYWEPSEDRDGEMWIPDAEVDETMRSAFKTYRVHRLYADPYYWGEYLSLWSGAFGDAVVKYPINAHRKVALACLNYRNAIETAGFSHDGDTRFIASVRNSHKHMHEFRDDSGERMWSIQKERPDSPLKIDAAYAAMLSWAAREDAVAAGMTQLSPGAVPIGYGNEDTRKPEFAGVRGRDF